MLGNPEIPQPFAISAPLWWRQTGSQSQKALGTALFSTAPIPCGRNPSIRPLQYGDVTSQWLFDWWGEKLGFTYFLLPGQRDNLYVDTRTGKLVVFDFFANGQEI